MTTDTRPTCPHCGAEIRLTHKMQTLQAQYVAHAWAEHRIPKRLALRELRGQ